MNPRAKYHDQSKQKYKVAEKMIKFLSVLFVLDRPLVLSGWSVSLFPTNNIQLSKQTRLCESITLPGRALSVSFPFTVLAPLLHVGRECFFRSHPVFSVLPG